MTDKNSKLNYWMIATVALAVVLCLVMCFRCCGMKVAVINTQNLFAHSSVIRNLQIEQQIKYAEIEKWVAESDKQIRKQPTTAKQKELMAKLQAELAQKQLAFQQEIAARSQQAEDEIVALIEKVAHKKGFKVVLVKSSLVTGGVDITDDVIAAMNNVAAAQDEQKDEETPAEADAEAKVETEEAPVEESSK
ncbi:MAG: OmpH family outer membrane protein [Alphaproteobacteria bacterium]|nr:OmpH family outer membrane protein [Alphaproteobacteria bacterium]